MPGPVVTWQAAMVWSWKRMGLDWTWGRNSLWWRWWATGTCCPAELRVPHHWKCLKRGWKGLWWNMSLPMAEELDYWSLKVSSNSNHSMVLKYLASRLRWVLVLWWLVFWKSKARFLMVTLSGLWLCLFFDVPKSVGSSCCEHSANCYKNISPTSFSCETGRRVISALSSEKSAKEWYN